MLLLFFTSLVSHFAIAQIQSPQVDFEDLRPVIQNSSVLVLGESHEALADKQLYVSVVKEIQRIDPAYNCLALELSETLQTEFLKINDPADYKDFLHEYLSQIPFYAKIYLAKTPAERAQFLQNFLVFFSPWLDTALEMKKSGGHAYLMDDLSKQSNDVVATMVFRNEMMGKRIVQSLQTQECTKVITINGAEHISKWHGDSLLDFLSNENPTGFLLTDVYLPDPKTIRIHLQDRVIPAER